MDTNKEPKTLPDLATKVEGMFKRGEREADGIGKILVPNTEAREGWVHTMCHEAHGDMMPDDWRYEFIGDALSCIASASNDDDDDSIREEWQQWIDGAYVYTHEQTAWLASRADRSSYCDEACEELGIEHADTMQRIALGMMREATEVFESVLASLQARLEESTEAVE